jgi:hypothetical protein
MPNSEVTIQDFIMPEYRGCKPEDYEFRPDGSIARKDRWEQGIREIAYILGVDQRASFEIDNLVFLARWLVDQVPDLPMETKE